VTTLAANSQRERAVAALRQHFLQGRLTAEELAERCERALSARTTADLREALRGLPRLGEAVEQARRHVGLVLTLTLLVGGWLFVSLVLLVAWVAALAFGDPDHGGLLAFPLVWLAVTAAAGFGGRRAVRRHRARP
jgi:hypothetical protein